MTIIAACTWSLARSLLVSFIAWPFCHIQVNWLRSLPDRFRQIAWWLLLVPFLCPELWTGYAWSGFPVRLAGSGFWERLSISGYSNPESIVFRDALVAEVLLDALLFFRMIPVGVLALFFAPPPRVSRSALFCWHLGQPKFGWRRSLCFWFERRGYTWPVFALMFVAAFQEFELASLIGRPAWTVWLFDAQVGGLDLSESLKKTVIPVFCQTAVLALLTVWVVRNRTHWNSGEHELTPVGWGRRCIAWGVIAAGWWFLIAIPAFEVGRDTIAGLGRVFNSPLQCRTLFSEIFWGMGYTITAASISTLSASYAWNAIRRSRWWTPGLFAISFPGLIGPLATGLVLIRLFQQPMLRSVYKTPVSLLFGMVLFLIPRAILLRALLRNSSQPTQIHLASLLASSPVASVRGFSGELFWQLRWRREFWCIGVLAYWAFFDLTTASLLAPVTIVSAPVMLYNQMHFGKNATLSALVLLTVIVPLGLFSVAGLSRRLIYHWFWR
jgi:hypothetical protein